MIQQEVVIFTESFNHKMIQGKPKNMTVLKFNFLKNQTYFDILITA